jgi:hypothetical protein
MRRLFDNNQSTTLAVALTATSGTMTMTVAASILGTFFGQTLGVGGFIQDDRHVMVTISNSLGTLHEVVAVIRNKSVDSGLVWTVVRGQEGTSPAAWAIGSVVSVNETADTLGRAVLSKSKDFLQVNNVSATPPYNAWDDNNQLFVDVIQVAANWIGSHFYASGIVAYFPTAQNYGFAVMSGTSHASTEPSGVDGGEVIDGSVKWKIFGDTIATLHDLPLDDGHYIGENLRGCVGSGISYGKGNLVIRGNAIGNACETMAFNSAAIGDGCSAHYNQSVALGISAQAAHSKGLFTNNAPGANLTFGIDGDFSTTDPDYSMASNLSGVLWSGAIDFTGGIAWTASTGIKEGRVRRPTTPNGSQYVRYDAANGGGGIYADNYAAANSTTGTTEPTWTTTQGDFIADDPGVFGAGWTAFPNVGRQLGLLPENFIVEEIGIIILEMSGVTAQPFVSFGKAGNNTLFVANTQTTNLSAANKVQRFVLTDTEAVTQITMSINTLATGSGATMLGRIYFKGFFCKHWL